MQMRETQMQQFYIARSNITVADIVRERVHKGAAKKYSPENLGNISSATENF